jgi:hypothetical protein
MSVLKDCMGHSLAEGDWVDFLPRTDVKWIGKITEVKEPSVSLDINQDRRKVPVYKIRLVFDITLTSEIPVYNNMTRVPPPGSDEKADKIMEMVDKDKPSPLQ